MIIFQVVSNFQVHEITVMASILCNSYIESGV